MAMLVIPAVDIKDGRCVRLLQGRMDHMVVYSERPELMAKKWKEEGAEWIHVVDLDGAVDGKPRNMDVVKHILKEVRGPVEIGGGIRDIPTIEAYLGMGVDRVVLGTVAQREPSLVEEACRRFPGRIAVSIDAKDGFVAIKGWRELTEEKAIDLARRFEGMGVSVIIYTDISRDGTLEGPNVEAIEAMADILSIPLIASGGVSSLEDIKKLREIGKLEGVIVGKALYSGAFTLKEAINAAGSKALEGR